MFCLKIRECVREEIFHVFGRLFVQVAQLSKETARRTSYFDSQNCEVEFLSHPFGGPRGCVRRWKNRGRLPMGNN